MHLPGRGDVGGGDALVEEDELGLLLDSGQQPGNHLLYRILKLNKLHLTAVR